MSRSPAVETGIFKLDIQLNEGNVFLHLEYKKQTFNKSDYLHMLEIWDEFIEYLISKDVKEVFSYVSKDEKIMKFQEMFGLGFLVELEEGMLFRRIL